MKLGTFTETNGTLVGAIATLTMRARVQIVPVDSKTANQAPDYRIKAGTLEIGAGWTRARRSGEGSYISIKLDDPSFAAPIYANLVKDRSANTYILIWSR
jgi:uncharacterized protein (DUF736 family)